MFTSKRKREQNSILLNYYGKKIVYFFNQTNNIEINMFDKTEMNYYVL